MDCMQARETISEAFDRGVADTPLAAEARKHCRGCKECRTFVEGLALLHKTPIPTAPPALVDAIVERGRKMAENGVRPVVAAVPPAPAPGQPAEGPSPAEAPASVPFELPVAAKRPEERDGWWWGTRIAASAAALVIVAFAASFAMQGFRAMRPRGAEFAATQSTGNAASSAPAPQATIPGSADSLRGSAETTEYAAKAALSGPRYVDVAGFAYVWIGDRTLDQGSLQTAGTITSSLATTTPPVTYDVWRSSGDAGVIFIRTDPASGTFAAFRAVTRTFQGKAYALSAGQGLPSYGVWPSLPSSLSTPTAQDGSPTFAEAGTDDTGLKVFAPVGAQPADGFAVAPGTTSTDPAGANPNWTWWVPKR